MKKRIVTVLICAVLIAQIITAAVSINSFKNAYIKDMENALRGDLNAVVLSAKDSTDYNLTAKTYKDAFMQNTRITFIAKDGRILGDSGAQTTENHLEREEVAQALKEGYGRANRVSATTRIDTLYVAKLMDNDVVIRIARPVDNANIIIKNTMPAMILILIVMLIIAIVFSFMLAKRFLRPFYSLEAAIQDYMAGTKATVEIVGDYKELEEISQAFLRISKRVNRYIKRVKEETSKSVVILDSIQEGLLILDEDSDVLLINKRARKIFEVDFDSDNVNILHFIRSSHILNKFDYSLKNKKRVVFDYKIKDNTYRFFTSIVNEPAISANGVGMLIIISDVTEIKKAEEMRKSFATNVSHELKTPLTSISGYAQLITHDMAHNEEKHYAKRIEEEADRLICLINDTLKLSELDHIAMDENITAIEVREVAEKVCALLEQNAKKRNISMEINGDIKFRANPNRLKELLLNLADNAVKYNRQDGKVEINLYEDEEANYISIKDTGIGVPKEEQDRVFERFYRAKNSGGGSIEGTGLGLAIAKHIMMLYKGDITLKSGEEGSEFVLRFPKK